MVLWVDTLFTSKARSRLSPSPRRLKRLVVGPQGVVSATLASSATVETRIHADAVNTPSDVIPLKRRLSGRGSGVVVWTSFTVALFLSTRVISLNVHVAHESLEEEAFTGGPCIRLGGSGTVCDVHGINASRQREGKLRMTCVSVRIILRTMTFDGLNVLRRGLTSPQKSRNGLRGTELLKGLSESDAPHVRLSLEVEP